MLMRITSPHGQDNWRSGDYYMLCDVCGFKYRKSEMQERWDKAWVCREDWEPRHPQESLRGRNEHINVPVARPEPTEISIGAGDVTQDDL